MMTLALFQTPAPDIVTIQGAPFWAMLPPEAITIIALGSIVGGVLVFWPLMRALGRRLEGRRVADPALMHEVESLRDRVAELESHHDRLAELEERVEFSERLLAKVREQSPPARS